MCTITGDQNFYGRIVIAMNLRLSSFCLTVDALCKRPKMYTVNGTYGEIVALIDGLAGGARVLPVAGHHSLDPFHRWLAKTDRFADKYGFTDYGKFREHFEDDKSALRDFAILFRQFCSELAEEEDTVTFNLAESKAKEILVLLNEIDSGHPSQLSELRELIQRKLESLEESKYDWHELFEDIRLFP